MTDTDIARLHVLRNAVEQNRSAYRSASRRDTKSLSEIAEILSASSDLTDAERAGMYRFLGECIREMCRYGMAAAYYGKAVKYAAAAWDAPLRKALESDIFLAAKLRNMYYEISDACGDLIETAAPLIGKERAEQLVQDGISAVLLRYDPVENTEDYLAINDDIEAQIDAQLGTGYYMGKCYEIWALKQRLLADFGIVWRSPSVLNPGMMFD